MGILREINWGPISDMFQTCSNPTRDIVLDEGDSHQHIEHTPLTSDKENIYGVLSTVPFHTHTHRMIIIMMINIIYK